MGFPPGLDCTISDAGSVSCTNKIKHTSFVGTFPSKTSGAKNCPIQWTSVEVYIRKEDDSHFFDFKDIRVSRGKAVCTLEICNKTWIGLSQGLLVSQPLAVSSVLSLKKCDSSFNYEFDITASQHEEIKNGLKEVITSI